MNEEVPVWRKVFIVLLLLFSVIRLTYTCSKMNNRNSQNLNTNDILNNQMYEDNARVNQLIQQQNLEKKGNDFLYNSYKNLDCVDTMQKQVYSILKLKKDSLVAFDMSTKIRIEKGFYFQNNHDDSLRLAFKSPKDLTIFIHDFESPKSEDENFKSLKKNSTFNRFKLDDLLTKTKTTSYSIVKNDMKFNGYALSFKNSNYQTFIEFESQKISGFELQMEALSYLRKNLIATKNTTTKHQTN